MDNSEKDRLIEELNQLSSDSLKNKQRMIEIAHVLVTYYMGDREEKDKKKS